MTCEHAQVRVIQVDGLGVPCLPEFPLTSFHRLVAGVAWCQSCGALRDEEGVWHLPESAQVSVVVAPPSPHRIQSTGGDQPTFPEFRPPEH